MGFANVPEQFIGEAPGKIKPNQTIKPNQKTQNSPNMKIKQTKKNPNILVRFVS